MQPEHEDAKKRAHRWWMGALLAAVALGLVLCYLPFEQPYAARGVVQLVEGWSYFTDAQPQPVAVERLDRYISLQAGETIVMTRAMTERAAHPSLLVRQSYMHVRVTLGGQVLFDNRDDPPGEEKGRSMRLVELPADYLGQELRVVASSPYELFAASPETVWFGDAEALAAHAVGMGARDVLLTFLLVFSGLTLLGFSVISRVGRQAQTGVPWDGILFGLFCVIYGLGLLGYSAPFLWAFPPNAGARLMFVLWFLFPAPMLWFLGRKCKAYRKLAFALAAAYSLVALVAICAGLARRIAFAHTLVFMNPALIAAALAALVLCTLEWAKRNAFYRMTAPAFWVLAASVVLSTIDIKAFFAAKELLRIAGLLLLVALVWADILRDYRAQRRREVAQNQLLALKEHLAAEQLEAAEAHSQETRLLRHEIRHHIAALTVLHRENKIEEIGSYLHKLDAMEQELDVDRLCAHPLVNAILCNANRLCRREGIAFRCEADVPASLAIPDADLSTLLQNMLENAVDAARQLENAEKWVEMRMRVKGNFLVIVCRNARRGEVLRSGGRFLSTKKDARFHGYGILAMKRIVEKRDSRLNIDYDDRSFSVKTILRISEGS